MIALGAAISPALSGATGAVPFNITAQLCYDHAFKTRVSLGVALGFAQTRYDNKAVVFGLGNPTEDYKIRSFSVVPYAKIFSKKYVAPWGRYFMLGTVVSLNFTTHSDYMYLTQKLSNHDTLLMGFGPAKQMAFNLDLLLGYGKTRVFKNKIVFDYGFNVHLLALLKGLSDSENNLSQEEYISKTSLYRIRGINRFNLFFKLGYLF